MFKLNICKSKTRKVTLREGRKFQVDVSLFENKLP